MKGCTSYGRSYCRRTHAIIDEKISKKKAEIEALETQKQKLLHPVTMKTVMEKAKASGLSPEEIAEKLGLEM